jgi:hypothetical protein
MITQNCKKTIKIYFLKIVALEGKKRYKIERILQMCVIERVFDEKNTIFVHSSTDVHYSLVFKRE